MRSTALALAALFSFAAWGMPRPTFETKNYGETFATGFVHTKEGEAFQRNAPHASFTRAAKAVPGKYSLKGKTGPIEDQGQCGSCWDFSLTTTLRSTLAAKGKDPGRLSFNYLLNCAQDSMGCWGGNFSSAQYLVKPEGAPRYGSDGDYTASGGACVHAAPTASAIKFHMLGANGSNPSFKDIAYVVGVLHKPVSVDVWVDDTWHTYASGIYNACNSGFTTNHMIVIEGYDCETSVGKDGNCVFDQDGNLPAGVGSWVVRNSWGEKWGEKGWMRTKATDEQGSKCNNIASDALYYDVE